jgi:hypothetical protein
MFPIALTRIDAEEEREEKEHDAVRCEFERCKKQRQLPCEDFGGAGDELFFTVALLRFFKRVDDDDDAETADATGTQRAESIILSNYYFLRAVSCIRVCVYYYSAAKRRRFDACFTRARA